MQVSAETEMVTPGHPTSYSRGIHISFSGDLLNGLVAIRGRQSAQNTKGRTGLDRGNTKRLQETCAFRVLGQFEFHEVDALTPFTVPATSEKALQQGRPAAGDAKQLFTVLEVAGELIVVEPASQGGVAPGTKYDAVSAQVYKSPGFISECPKQLWWSQEQQANLRAPLFAFDNVLGLENPTEAPGSAQGYEHDASLFGGTATEGGKGAAEGIEVGG